jgi:hypothetical protein
VELERSELRRIPRGEKRTARTEEAGHLRAASDSIRAVFRRRTGTRFECCRRAQRVCQRKPGRGRGRESGEGDAGELFGRGRTVWAKPLGRCGRANRGEGELSERRPLGDPGRTGRAACCDEKGESTTRAGAGRNLKDSQKWRRGGSLRSCPALRPPVQLRIPVSEKPARGQHVSGFSGVTC